MARHHDQRNGTPGAYYFCRRWTGSFEPRKPPIENIEHFEDRGVEYFVRNPEFYKNRRVVIAGGGDSALDWTIYLADLAIRLP